RRYGPSRTGIYLHHSLATCSPTRSHFRAARRVIVCTRIRSAFVEHHRDVAAECRLDFHRNLGRNECRLSIDVILKLGALLGDLAQLREGKNLVTTAIRQDRSVPIHEFVKSAKMRDHLDAGSNE